MRVPLPASFSRRPGAIREPSGSRSWSSRARRGPGAAAVLRGDDSGLDPVDRALAAWARKVARDPNGTTADDVQELRDAGFDDGQVFAVTAYVAIRLAFSTVNDALGAAADAELRAAAPAEVRDAVTYGR